MKKQPLKEMLKAIGGGHLLKEESIPNIRKLQITNAFPDVIKHDHIDKTHNAIQKIDKKLAAQFKKLGDKYKKIRNNFEAKYDKTKNPKDFTDGLREYEKVGKELIKFAKKNL